MAIDFCDLCNDVCTGKNTSIGNNNWQETWRTLVAQALCQIANNPDSAQATQLPQVSYTAAELTADFSTYADAEFIDSELALKRLRVVNTTDAGIEISLDGGTTTHFIVLANTDKSFDLGNYEFSAQTDFQIRIVGTAGLGTLYLEGGY